MPLRDATTRSRAASHLSAPCADHKFTDGQERTRATAMGEGYGVTISLGLPTSFPSNDPSPR